MILAVLSAVKGAGAARIAVWLATVALVLAVFAMGAPAVSGQAAEPVFGLRGRLSPATNQSYATVIETGDGQRSGVVGSTPAVEERLVALAERGAAVRLWGSRQAQAPIAGLPLIVVTSLIEDVSATPPPSAASTPEPSALPTATSTPTATVAGPATATVNVYALYVREGPGATFTPIGAVQRGGVCTIEARTPDGGWLQVLCPSVGGWLRQGYVSVSGTLEGVPFVSGPTPTPIATPTPAGSWRVLGYDNPNLSGPPVVNLEAPTVDFDWGLESPHDSLPVDNFSLRLDRNLRFAPGMHQITLTYDDGARMYLNGQLVVNDWHDGAERTSVWRGQLGGEVQVRIEYFDAFGDARLKFDTLALQAVLPTSTPIPPVVIPAAPSGAWQAVYYNNPELAEPVAFSRVEAAGDVYPLNREFSVDSPVPEVISEDNWSARWRGRFPFEAGDYRIQARGNEGVRVYLDGIKVIDAWPNLGDTQSIVFRGVGAGEHEVTVQMYDAGGEAWVRTWWEQVATATPNPTATVGATPSPTVTPDRQ